MILCKFGLFSNLNVWEKFAFSFKFRLSEGVRGY